VGYESKRFDWEACPEEYCGEIEINREKVVERFMGL
jgi:hypothetical protein